MPRKSAAKSSSRGRVHQSGRPTPRPTSVIPIEAEIVPASQGIEVPIERTAIRPAARPAPRAVRPSSRPLRSRDPVMITDYGYVIEDLKRIGILAGAAIVSLLALTFVIH